MNNGENDIIAVDLNKVIQLYTSNSKNQIIITIFQFYNGNKALSIKIYNLESSEGYKGFIQSRINMLKDSFLISFSAKNGNS